MDRRRLAVCLATLAEDPFALDGDSLPPLLEAAADAGFDGVSAWSFHAHALGPRAACRFAEAGLDVVALEALVTWGAGDEAAAVEEAAPVFDLASALGCRVVAAVCLDPVVDEVAAAAGLAAVCRAARPHDIRLAVEFLPWTGIGDLATARRIVEAAGEPEAGLCVDTWHLARTATPPAALADLAGGQVTYLQLADAAPDPGDSLEHEAMHGRLLPGEGTVDFAAVVAAVDATGATPVTAAEVFADEVARQGPSAAARRMYAACRAVLDT